MRNPSLFKVKELQEWNAETFDGKRWYPARPLPYYGLRIIENLRLALGVLVGKYDAVEWPNTQLDK